MCLHKKNDLHSEWPAAISSSFWRSRIFNKVIALSASVGLWREHVFVITVGEFRIKRQTRGCLFIQQMKKKDLILTATLTKVHCGCVERTIRRLSQPNFVVLMVHATLCRTTSQAYHWAERMLPRRLPTWGSRVSGWVVVEFGTYEFRVCSQLLKKENYMLLSAAIFSAHRNNILSWYNLWEVFSRLCTNFRTVGFFFG